MPAACLPARAPPQQPAPPSSRRRGSKVRLVRFWSFQHANPLIRRTALVADWVAGSTVGSEQVPLADVTDDHLAQMTPEQYEVRGKRCRATLLARR